MRYKLERAPSGKPSWFLYDQRRTILAWGGEYQAAYKADEACRAFKAAAATGDFEVYAEADGKWHWRARIAGRKAASSGAGFPSKAAAQKAADDVRANAGAAAGP